MLKRLAPLAIAGTVGLATILLMGSSPANAVLREDVKTMEIITDMIDGIKIQSPTRVQAGKYFQVKLTSTKSKFTTNCWLNWDGSHGFKIPNDFKMTLGKATVKILPVEPGKGAMNFGCGASRTTPKIGGSTLIYISP